jgi:putative NADPH-quinone reductase
MAGRRILIIDGHPDPDEQRFVHALAARYAQGAASMDHEVRSIRVTDLHFPLIASRAVWEGNAVPEDIRRAQESVTWAEHLLILYPLWLGDMPALLKGFLEQVMRPSFAFAPAAGKRQAKRLAGRTARLVVTMGMPALFYRAYFGAHSVKSFERNILKFVGIRPAKHLLIGNVEANADARQGWLDELFGLGEGGI